MEKLEGTLVWVDSNAYDLMGYFIKQAKSQWWVEEEIEKVLKEAKSGDYDHLIATLNNYFKN